MRRALLTPLLRVLDAKTIWLSRQQLTRASPIERLFARFDRVLREAGYLDMGGKIVDATVIQARQPQLIQNEKTSAEC